MQILTGRVRGREIKKNRDGTTNKILLQVELTSPDDIQTVEWINHDGEYSSPPDNSLVVVVSVSNSYKIAIACDDGILAESQPGEKNIYSQLNGVIKAFIKFFKTGLARLSGTVVEILSTGNTKVEAGEDIELTATGDTNIQAGGDIGIQAGGDLQQTAIGAMVIQSVGDANIQAGGDAELTATGKTEINGSPVEINGSLDNAVRFSILEAEMIVLKAQVQGHVHEFVTPGPPGSFGGPTNTVFTLDISAAKVDKVKLP